MRLRKFNANHDHATGRFTTGPGGSVATLERRERRRVISTGARAESADFLKLLRSQGGFTLDAATKKAYGKGYAVATKPRASYHALLSQTDTTDITRWLRHNAPLLAAKGAAVGGWVDPASHKVWLDVVSVYGPQQRAAATAAGKAANQIAIFDLGTGTEIGTGGSGITKAEGIIFHLFDANASADDIVRTLKRIDMRSKMVKYNHAHHPAGSAQGGQFASGDGSGGGGATIAGLGSVDDFLKANPQLPGEDIFVYQSRIVSKLAPKPKNELLFMLREHYPPVDYLAKGMTDWRKTHGLPEPKADLSTIPVPIEQSDAVARAFEGAPDAAHDPKVRAAYEDFKKQSQAMYDWLTAPVSEGGLGVKVDFTTKVDPYSTAAAQAEDLRRNHHITMQSGLGGHHEATMTTAEYDRFRTVHDVFGHAGIGGGFDRHGEYQAWLAHVSMYTGEGQKAMSSEYRGVNTASWGGDPGSPGTGKSILLPDQFLHPFDAQGHLKPLPVWKSDGLALRYLAKRLGLDTSFPAKYEPSPLHHSGSVTKFNHTHEPAGSSKGGEFASTSGEGFGPMPTISDFANMEPIKGPLGSQGGQWYQDENGREFLVKRAKSAGHAFNEVAAGEVYRMMGVPFPRTKVLFAKGKFFMVSEKIHDLSQQSNKWWAEHPEAQALAAKHYAVDAILSHWDVAGLSADNTLVDKHGTPVRIESGGAMAYRAMGTSKAQFKPGAKWTEPLSMRTSDQGRQLYGRMTDRQAADSLRWTYTHLDIGALGKRWAKLGVPAKLRRKWLATLNSRRDQITGIVHKLTQG